MLVRICFLVCAGILLARANPVPQDQAQLSDNDQLQELNITTELPKSENAVEPDSDTEPPNNNNDSEGTEDQNNDEGSGDESELKSDSGADESSSDGNEDESQPESDESANGSEPDSEMDDPSNTEGDNNEESESESETRDSSDHTDENKSEVDDDKNDDGEYESDDRSENGESESDSDNPENDNSLSIVQSKGVILRVYKFLQDYEDVTCQEISKKGEILEKRCFVAPPSFLHLQREHVSVFYKYIDGEDFICQEIISYVKGPLQVLCASNERFFYRESTVLHPGSSYFGHIDINLPLY